LIGKNRKRVFIGNTVAMQNKEQKRIICRNDIICVRGRLFIFFRSLLLNRFIEGEYMRRRSILGKIKFSMITVNPIMNNNAQTAKITGNSSGN
jgi:hypothetical protein